MGSRGADPDCAQWAKKEGGSPLNKGAPEALANRSDYYEVRIAAPCINPAPAACTSERMLCETCAPEG